MRFDHAVLRIRRITVIEVKGSMDLVQIGVELGATSIFNESVTLPWPPLVVMPSTQE
jgi:hypothetical protein